MNLVEETILFAVGAHEGQVRKITYTPYILHPLEVASIISTMTGSHEVIAAGVLHDTVEDCGVDPKEIKAKFGARVAALVQSETEDKLSERPPDETWMQRKEESLLMLENTKDIDVKILWLADKLSNMRSFHREFLKSGCEVWSHLHQKDPKMHEWYYRTIAKCMPELADTAAYKEYTKLLDEVFVGGDTQ